jgi:hypothetical protein
VFFDSGLKPLKNLDYRREISLGFASLFSWISFPLALISLRVDLDFLPLISNPSAALGRARRSVVDVERLRVELARKLDVSSAETSIPP